MSPAHPVLLITDDPTFAKEAERFLRQGGFQVTISEPGPLGELLAGKKLLIVDGAAEFLTLSSEAALEDLPPCVVVGENRDARGAVSALKTGAADYLIKDESGFLDSLAGKASAVIRRWEERRDQALERADRAALEIQIRQHQRMDAVSRLAGGVAHDMNNILGSIMALASYILARLEPEDPLMDKVKETLDACERGRGLTHNLLGFSRSGQYGEESLSLNQAAQDVTDLLDRIIPKTVVVEKDLATDLFAFRGDQAQIYHAIMNICVNAAEAVGEHGRIGISTGKEDLTQEDLEAHPHLTPGPYLVLRIEDDGKGMDAETLERCFEPFFTTRDQQEGNGLGLSMVYGAVRNHGGLVRVDSAPGRGTKFSLFFPKPDRDPTARIVTEKRETLPPAGTDTILFVDDEKVFRETWARLLRKRGFSVITAANGQQALEIFHERPGEISLVILDLIMPILDGLETFKRLREKDPGVRILMSTGFANEQITARLVETGITGFMTKPFDVETLMDNVVSVMTRSS